MMNKSILEFEEDRNHNLKKLNQTQHFSQTFGGFDEDSNLMNQVTHDSRFLNQKTTHDGVLSARDFINMQDQSKSIENFESETDEQPQKIREIPI